MQMITNFYEKYLKNEAPLTAERDDLTTLISRFVSDKKSLMLIEDAITAHEDKAAESAFRAGFKAAFQLIKEALS